jgi:hypothetical protein
MSDIDNEKQQFEEFKGTLSGSMEGLRSGIIADDIFSQKELHKKEKQEQHKDLYEAVLDQLEQAYTNLINEINNRLKNIHKEMEENRQHWDIRANRLEAIDELLTDVKNGKELNKIDAQKIIKSTGHRVSSDATNADYYTFLVAIKTDDLKYIDVLDNDFQNLEKRERFYLDAKIKANAISNDNSLDENQRLAAYENLSTELNNTDFVEVGYDIGNSEQKSDAEIVSKNDYHQEVEVSTYSLSRLNF